MCRLAPTKKGDKRKRIVSEMLKVYGDKEDWLNYKIEREVTAHHIVKREHGGRLEWGNIALLTPRAHEYLHVIENRDRITYKLLNKMFQIINEGMKEPSEVDREIIRYILEDFESMYKEETNSKGKRLIKEKYKR